MKKRLIALAASSLLVLQPLMVTQAAGSDDIKQQMSSNQDEASKLLDQVNAMTKKVADLQKQVKDKDAKIKDEEAKIQDLQTKLDQMSTQIQDTQATVKARKAELKRQLRSLQKSAGDGVTGNVYTDFVLNGSDLADVVGRAFAVQKISQANQDALKATQKSVSELKRLKSDQETAQKALKDQKSQLEDTRQSLVVDQKAAETQQQALQKEIDAHAMELVALQAKYDQAVAAEAAKKAQDEADKKAAEEAKQHAANLTASDDYAWPFGSWLGTEDGGQFGHTTGYPRPNDYHDGVDFGSATYGSGSDIHAVQSGTVVVSGLKGDGLGYVIVIKGANGISTVYQEFSTSASDAYVKEGQTVKVGDVIGKLTGSHLHLGMTKQDWNQAVMHSFDASGGWLDPVTIISGGK